ncbi:MAG: class I SAM-dependent methyltransferase [Acidimicrobiia bacterium]|nr:class I SAM-dependent methyltransferase [Acidimicrobiia bacterium]
MTTVSNPPLSSRMCTQEQLESHRFRAWAERLAEEPARLHRKLWEYCYIAEALAERGMLQPGITGLGFAVGTEPLASLFASSGVTVVATDMDPEEAAAKGWVDTNQHAAGIDALNDRGLCPDSVFRTNCSFRAVDMNDIPEDLTGFDFVWSSCAFEHLGSIEHGIQFVVNAMRCLKPGGVAVHTTEFNCSSNDATLTEGGTVLFRRRDFEEIARRLHADGHDITLDFTAGSLPADHFVDLPPYKQDVHLKLMLADYVCSSYGIIARAAS